MAPTPSNGSVLIYTRVVRPFFLKNEAKIDDVVKNIKDKASEAADKIKDEGEQIYTAAQMLRFPFTLKKDLCCPAVAIVATGANDKHPRHLSGAWTRPQLNFLAVCVTLRLPTNASWWSDTSATQWTTRLNVTQCLRLTDVEVQSLLSIYLEEKTQHCEESDQDIKLLQSIWPLSSPSCSFIILTCGN